MVYEIYWVRKFGEEKARQMTQRIHEITSYLEHYQLLLISRPDQFKQFTELIKNRREKMKVSLIDQTEIKN